MDRLFDFILERELARDDGDVSLAEQAMVAIRDGMGTLERTPHICRRSPGDPAYRELIIRSGRTGYVALFEIVGDEEVVIAAVRHQLEDDYD